MNPTPVKEERVDFWLGNRHISFAKEEVDADPQLKDELEYLWHQNLTNPIQFSPPRRSKIRNRLRIPAYILSQLPE